MRHTHPCKCRKSTLNNMKLNLSPPPSGCFLSFVSYSLHVLCTTNWSFVFIPIFYLSPYIFYVESIWNEYLLPIILLVEDPVNSCSVSFFPSNYCAKSLFHGISMEWVVIYIFSTLLQVLIHMESIWNGYGTDVECIVLGSSVARLQKGQDCIRPGPVRTRNSQNWQRL